MEDTPIRKSLVADNEVSVAIRTTKQSDSTTINDYNMTSSADTTKQLIERYYYKGWNKADETVIKEILDENIKFRGSLGRKQKRGHEFFINYMKSLFQALAMKVEVEDIVVSENGQKVAVRLTNRGIHKGTIFGVQATNMEVSWNTAAFFTIDKNGRVIELWNVGDVDSLKNQLNASVDAKAFNSINGEDYY